MDFGFSEEQELLRRSAREFLEAECPTSYARAMMESDAGYLPEKWRQMAELGWLGLIFPEQYGGAGLDMVDLTVVLEEMGRVVLPGPFFPTVLLGGMAVLLGGNEEQKKRLLPEICRGNHRATLAWLEETGSWEPSGVLLPAKREGAEFVLEGTKLFVHDAHNADWMVVAARSDGGTDEHGIVLLVVESDRPGIRTRVMKTMDQTRKLCEVEFRAVRVPATAVLADGGTGWELLEKVADRAKVGLCAEMCGGMEKVLEMSVAYAKVREQFGRPIGSFQAIQHKCANMLVQVESSKSATYYAAWAVANNTADAHLAASMAKAYCSDAYRTVAGEGIQIHGGIGFTWEHDMHLYFKRAKGSEVTFGDATWNRELVAREVLDKPQLSEQSG
ncbi:MAG: acyl-CoA/acyl-ACP dehydrogenase [Candidatus Binatia bacterium]|nr:acyl-CoA/acyl-ACP dehydrogenase [Candidatus Binatia bacterium]